MGCQVTAVPDQIPEDGGGSLQEVLYLITTIAVKIRKRQKPFSLMLISLDSKAFVILLSLGLYIVNHQFVVSQEYI